VVEVTLGFEHSAHVLVQRDTEPVVRCEGVNPGEVGKVCGLLRFVQASLGLISRVVPNWSEYDDIGAHALELPAGTQEVVALLREKLISRECQWHPPPNNL